MSLVIQDSLLPLPGLPSVLPTTSPAMVVDQPSFDDSKTKVSNERETNEQDERNSKRLKTEEEFGGDLESMGSPTSLENGNLSQIKNSNCFVSNIPPEITEETLLKLFSSCGKITSLKVIVDFQTKISKGYGFVKYETNEQGKVVFS